MANPTELLEGEVERLRRKYKVMEGMLKKRAKN
jgi:hypothetical protein